MIVIGVGIRREVLVGNVVLGLLVALFFGGDGVGF